ncbi:VWA domain-containing protein [soil metagenome]
MTFDVRTDRTHIRTTGGSDRFVLVRFTAPEARAAGARQPLNVAFVLDRYGSMSGEKIALVKDAVTQSLARLRPSDRFAIVTYDDIVDMVVASTRASAEAKRLAAERLRDVDARGSTDLGAGWLRGCEQVAAHLDGGQVTRVELLTDGLANHGITDLAELQRHAAALRARGIVTTTFGVGADFDEAFLHGLRTAGGGNYYFIENARQIADHVTSELQETIEVVARDVTLEIDAPEGVLVEPLTAISREQRGSHWRLGLGDLVSGQEVTAVFRVNFPAGTLGEPMAVRVTVSDRARELREPEVGIVWEYGSNASNDEQPRDREVDREVARLYAARAQFEAVALNRKGELEQARAVLTRVADRIESYAGSDRELQRIVHDLRDKAVEFAVPMPELDRKRSHFAAASMSSMRDPRGKARRRAS